MPTDSYSSTHPPLPPTSEDDRDNWLRLLRSRRVGPSTFFRLMQEHGSARAALSALPDVAAAAGVRSYQACPEALVAKERALGRQMGATLLALGEPHYPALLKEISDPPPLIWALGNTERLTAPMVALVGARNASSLGLRMAGALAKGLGQAGYVTVSGLARGVDGAVHRASLNTGTVAVLGGGLGEIYPAEHIDLSHQIAETGGVLLSEQPLSLRPMARHFPARNRIIAGMAPALVVVEAAAKSGSLITARAALDASRDVLAVPGHPFDARASGCNMLIRDGARLVRGVSDVLEALPPMGREGPPLPEPAPESTPETTPDAKPARRDFQTLHSAILERLAPAPLAEDALVRELKTTSVDVLPALTELELSGRIERQAGGLLARRA